MPRIFRVSATCLGIVLAGAGYFNVQAARLQSGASSTAQKPAAAERAFFDQYCISCHSEKLKTGGVVLETANTEHVAESAELFEKVAHMLRTGSMPPLGRPRPDAAVAQQVASWLEHDLDLASVTAPNPGRIPPHRLNRTEYANAIRDLLGVEIPSSLLPADNSILGFDNIADALTVSPTLLERYMSVARQVARLAIGDSTMMVAPVEYQVDTLLKQDDRLNEDLPFGTRGVTIRHTFPLDGEYVVSVKLKRDTNEYIRGLGQHPQPMDIRLDGVRVKVFADAGLMKGIPPADGYDQDDLGTPDWEKNSLDGDNALEVRFPVKAGARVLAVALPARRWQVDEEFNVPPGVGREQDRDGNITIKVVDIAGPFEVKPAADSASRRRIFTCKPANENDELKCATTILTSLARRAYRRPLVDADVQSLLKFCRAGRIRGFDGCIESGLERILASPYFLFRVESVPDGKSTDATAPSGVRVANVAYHPGDVKQSAAGASGLYRISDLDLASRISFFLWSSIPDDELLDVATKGKLREPAVLERQVKRMLADPRSKALVENFGEQWLELRKLDGPAPVEAVYPSYDGELRQAFREETERFMDYQVKEDRPMTEMLTANYSFINERLAKHYGIPNVAGTHFRKMTMPENRVGILTQGSILTITSQANRTSPVLRGKFILNELLGAPTPPPPPGAAANFKGNVDEDGAPTTVRAALEQHRKNPVCANCHARMDPWGFALDNYDGIGAWRDEENYDTIDVNSVLSDGTKLQGPAGVRQVLLARKDQFVSTVSEKLLVYALGRPVEYYDKPALRKISHDASAHENRWSSVILGIVNSMPFQFQTKGGVE